MFKFHRPAIRDVVRISPPVQESKAGQAPKGGGWLRLSVARCILHIGQCDRSF